MNDPSETESSGSSECHCAEEPCDQVAARCVVPLVEHEKWVPF